MVLRPKKIIIGFMIAALISLLTVGAVLFYASQTPKLGGDFSALTEKGVWNFSDDPKPLNLLYVGYVKCPDVCPMALSFSAEAFRQLTDKERSQVRLTFVSVDIEHDTAKSVSDYALQFNPKFIGLTGSLKQMDKIMKLIGASYMVEPNPKSYLGYSIAHTDRIFFLNKKGYVLDSLANPRSAESVVQKIKENL
ncbi:MAG: SCO family protein [Bdellovibrio sp.]|nr:SCO family protein [Bdellovibrio sp.]